MTTNSRVTFRSHYSLSMDRITAHLVVKAALIAAAPKVDPQTYHKEHGRCPRGYRWVKDHCEPTTKKAPAPKAKPKDYNLGKLKDAKTINDIPNGVKGIKAAIGHLGLSKYPPPDIDPSTIKMNLSGDVDSHSVMTWKDKKGRTQSAYSDAFKKRNAAHKWERVKKLGPKYDKAIAKFTKALGSKRASDRDKDSAAAMLIIAKTGLRPGGEAHLKASGHRGVGTLSPENVTIEGDTVRLKFIGKAGKENTAEINDPELAKYMAARVKNPASKDRLFASKDADLKKTMKAGGLGGFKPKDFRTLRAGKLASSTLADVPDPPPPLPASVKKAKALLNKRIKQASTAVSDELNNTPAVAKSSYINPAIIQGWLKLVGGEKYVQASDAFLDRLTSTGWVDWYVEAAPTKPTADEVFRAVGEGKPTAEEIMREAMKVTLPGADQKIAVDDDDDLQLEADPLPL